MEKLEGFTVFFIKSNETELYLLLLLEGQGYPTYILRAMSSILKEKALKYYKRGLDRLWAIVRVRIKIGMNRFFSLRNLKVLQFFETFANYSVIQLWNNMN